MTAEQLLREGNLAEALKELQADVRKNPADAKFRVFLFQLLVVLGDWPRAMTQLNVAGDLDAGTLAMVQTYREALNCEVFRSEVFAGQRSPVVFGEPQKWIALMMEALKLSAGGEHARSQDLRDQAFEMAPATGGTIDGQPFEWISDADGRLGPVLEAVVNGRYYWIPFDSIRKILIEEPADLRDIVWMPAQFLWANGGEAVGLIPTRYPGSENHDNAEIKLGRRTEWVSVDTDVFHGAGQRILATDGDEYPLMDVRSIELQTGSDDSLEPAADTGSEEPKAPDG